MAWENTLLDASFRDIPFEVVSTGDDIERAVVVYEYPYVDGASVDDMGRRPRRISMTAVFYGDDYENRLEEFLKALDEVGTGPLVHPIFGEKNAQFLRGYVPHDGQHPDYTQVTLEFLEVAINAPLFSRSLPVQQVEQIDQAAQDALDAARAGFNVDIKSALNLPALLRDKLSTDLLGAIGTMQGYVDQLVEARGWIASGLYYLDNPIAFVDDIAGGMVSRVKALFSSMDLRSGYSGGSGAVFERGSMATVWQAPLTNLQQPFFTPAATVTGPLTTNPDEVQPFVVSHLVVQQSLAIASGTAAIFSAALSDTVLSPQDIEKVAADGRAAINAAIALVQKTYPDIVRSRPITEPLKTVAMNITKSAEVLILAKPALQDRVVSTPGNLQLIAHLWYGEYQRADELLRLNPQVRNPNFVANGTVLRAYSK